MDRLPAETIDDRAVTAFLPPLVKGYLRAGCKIGDGAVVDHQFQTTDVCVVLITEHAAARYRSRYGSEDEEP
jgi:putative hemolysin